MINSLNAYNGNNLDFIENNSIDFILTDPPFNISKETNFHTYEKNTIHSHKFDEKMEKQWDTVNQEEFLGQLTEWSNSWSRVLKRGGSFAVFCADSYISHTMDAMREAGLSPSRVFSWRKNNAVPVNRGALPMSATEYVITGVKKGKRTFNANVNIEHQSIDEKIIESVIVADKASSILYSEIRKAIYNNDLNSDDHVKDIGNIVEKTISGSTENIIEKVKSMYKDDKEGNKYLQACVPNYIQNPLKTGKRIHATEKPVDLLKYFIALYSTPGDTVLDSFSGSGSTAEAALLLNRNAVIVEQDQNVFNASLNRLQSFTEEIILIANNE